MNMSNSVKLYAFEKYTGKAVTLTEECFDITKKGLASGASSIIVPETSGKWDVFTKPGFGLPVNTLLTGRRYDSPADMGLLSPIISIRPSAKNMSNLSNLSNSVKLYGEEQFGGNTVTLTEECTNLAVKGLKEGASSVVISNDRDWIVFNGANFSDPQQTLRKGHRYTDLAQIGLEQPIMSAKPK